jgi:hypothetical protein
MQFQESKPWINSIRRMSSSPTRGNRRAILCVETMEGRLSLSAMPLLPAVQMPLLPAVQKPQPAIIAICPADPTSPASAEATNFLHLNTGGAGGGK